MAVIRWWRAIRDSLVWTVVRRQGRWLWATAVVFFLNLGLQLSLANLTLNMVDRGIVAQIVPLGGFLVPIIVTAILVAITSVGQTLLLNRIGYQLEFALRTRMYEAIQSADINKLDALAGGQLVTRSLTDLALVQH